MTRARLAIALLALTACGAPTAPSAQIAATISGTVQPGAFDVQRFFVTTAGVFEFTLQTLTPGNRSVVGVGFGELYIAGRDCYTSGSATASAANVGQPLMWPKGPGVPMVAAVAISEGPHCLKVYDPAYYDQTMAPLQAPQTYTFELVQQ